jgi:hypothetical protein
VEYKGYLIEAFEEWPRRWFANVRRLDDQAIPGMQFPSLRTLSVRPSKAAAIGDARAETVADNPCWRWLRSLDA